MSSRIRTVAILTISACLLAAAQAFADAAPLASPQTRVARANTALETLLACVERDGVEIGRLRTLGAAPPARLADDLKQARAGVRATVLQLSGLHWDVVQPALATAHRIEGRIAELEKDLPNAAMPAVSARAAAESASGTGAVSGTVTDQATGTPLAGVQVTVTNASCCNSVTVATDASGSYFATGLATGIYKANTSNSLGYVNQLFDGLQCGTYGCNLWAGTPIAVTDGAVTPGVNFALQKTGGLAGTVTDATTGLVLSGLEVDLYDVSGGYQGFVLTGTSGTYQFLQLIPGTYFVLARSETYLDQLYQGILCESACPVTNGTPVPVAPGAVTPSIDFSLQLGGSVTGTITDASSGAPISGNVYLYDASGAFVGNTWAGSDGTYSIPDLPTGTYFATASSWNYVPVLYDGILCTSTCTVTSGTPISVTVGHGTPNIDFSLPTFGSYTGQVTDSSSGFPVANAAIESYDSSGNMSGYVYSDQNGFYAIGGLLAGTYFAVAQAPGYIGELYNGITCYSSCDPTTGTGIAVTLGGTTVGINFGLTLGGGVMGSVTASGTGAQLGSIRVDLYDTSGTLQATAHTSGNGGYAILGLVAGTYYARAWDEANHAYLGQLYNGIPCDPSCTVTAGTPITVTLGYATGGINFALQKLGIIAGHVTDAGTGLPLGSEYVTVYDSTGAYVGYAYSDYGGAFAVGGLQAGTYYAMAAAFGYVTQVYNAIQCLTPCTVTAGTPILVTLGTVTSGIDFHLTSLGGIAGTVTDAATGIPVPWVNVELYDASGATAGWSYTLSDGSYSFRGLPPGTYFAVTRNSSGYVDELYDNLDCGGPCDVTAGTPIQALLGTVTDGVNFKLHMPYFADVPLGFWARSYIEACYVAGVTSGCSTKPMLFCPTSQMDRWQMAVFLAKAKSPAGVPVSGTVPGMGDYDCVAGGQSVFADVPPEDPGCPFIHFIAAQGITAGCGNGDYCPLTDVNRWQMAVFMAKAIATGPIPVSGTVPGMGPYDCVAGGQSVFGDVPPEDPGCPFIHYIAAQGITAGCGNGDYCPALVITRDQTAVFLARGFGLHSYGP